MKTILLLAALFGASACAQPVTLVLVRHAEKAPAPSEDPPLTTAGEARAKELARVLRDVRPAAIYVTKYRRTQDTAHPFADAAAVTPTVVATTPELLGRIRALRGRKTVVVVGHSDTVPQIIQSLGGGQVTIGESEYDRLFVLTLTDMVISKLERHSLTALRYGAR